MFRKPALYLFVTIFCNLTVAAQKPITLEDIWQKNTFSAKSVPGFNFQNDGQHYTTLENNVIKQYDLTSGEFTKVIFDLKTVPGRGGMEGEISDYVFSSDESKILFNSSSEAIYRRSSKGFFYIWDSKDKTLAPLYAEAKQSNACFNPQGTKVAFVSQNNLFYKDLEKGKIVQVTTDGLVNHIINGMCDWVYEEEFEFTRAFQWSADGQKLAFMRFDESRVKEYTLQYFRNDLYPENYTFKYPKVGEENSIVSVFIFDASNGKTASVDVGAEQDQYIPRIAWTRDPATLCVFRMNRLQNQLELLLADAGNGQTRLLMKENNPYYIEINDNLRFLNDGKHFLWTSDKSGYTHIYLYNMQGQVEAQLTSGNYDVTGFYGADEKRGMVYYQAAETSPVVRQVYAVDLKGHNKRILSEERGVNNAQFSSTYDYYVLTHSSINTPPVYTVYNNTSKMLRVIEDNSELLSKCKEYGISNTDFYTFTTSEGTQLNGWMIKPADFADGKKYPVFMTQYSGPGSQQVLDQWGGANYWWYQMLSQKGYIVACVDPRGTGGRGEAFQKITYLQLGKYETTDQIEAAKYLAAQPYVDASRIGIFGWSYGGYMSSLCILKGNDVFKTAIAVAPVTNWKWYDSIYTERYMRTEKENPEGYRDNSPVNFAERLKGNFLIVHGLTDDNVHFQNSAEMVNALVKAGKDFDSAYYPNRNHGIGGGNTRLHLYHKMTNFLLEKL